ncbi:hypothetical protein GCM10020255_018330 [Rhodococcus baikonurensis]
MPTRGALFDPVFGATRVSEHLSDQAWVTALLDVEAALSCAMATVGLADGEHCAAVAAELNTTGRPGHRGARPRVGRKSRHPTGEDAA